MLNAKKDKQPVKPGWKPKPKGGDKMQKQGSANLRKGKYVS